MPLSTSAAARQLSDGNANGTVLGRSPTDLISFFGATPITQPGGAIEAAASLSVGGGIVATSATSQSPASVAIQTSAEVALSLFVGAAAGTGGSFALASTDFVVVNKPTQQAGIGIGSARVSGTQVAVAFSNFTAATVTPTAGEKYGVAIIRGLAFTTQTVTPAVVAAATTAEQLFTVPGIPVGAVVAAMPPSTVTNINIANVRVAAANQVGITFSNASPTTATTPPSGTWTFWATNGLAGANNLVGIQANDGNPGGPTGSTAGAFSFTVTGLAVTDTVVGVSKPTAQAGLITGNGFVSAVNVLGVAYSNFGPTVTPTTNEIYGVTIYRPTPAAPIVTYQQALSPVGVPANTTSSQLFTVTGIAASSIVWLNKPSVQAGLGIQGVRATTNTNQIEITFINDSAATITPTAGEVYSIANAQQAVPDAGDTWTFSFTPQMAQAAQLADAVRSALVSLGLMAGA